MAVMIERLNHKSQGNKIMAIIEEIDQGAFEKWLSDRPRIIKELAKKIPPGRLYLLKTSNHRVFPYSYNEDGTLTVVVSGEYNSVCFERNVFGIKPDDLEECDLPDKNEILGAVLTEENEINEFIDFITTKETKS